MKEYITKTELGTKAYYKDKEMTIFHREDGPAIEWPNGDKSWYLNDKLHRMGGPAIEYADGSKGWFVNGEFIVGINKSGNIIERME